MAMIICPKCGGQISDRAPRCPHCGYVRSNDNQPPQPTPPAPQQQPIPQPTQAPAQRPAAKSGGKLTTTHIVIIAAALIVGIAICVAAILLTRNDEKQSEIIEVAPIESPYSTTDDGEEQHIEADEFQQEEAAAEEDFIWLSDSYINMNDIIDHGYSRSDARVLRNAIFARHGYRFKSQDLKDYFNQFSWYMPRFDDVTSHLSEVERENIQFLKSLE
ncbi:MAG: YARHG domain-containing protein [Bacteroidales bacterium]|nr:YARHG domain-containing protein [Bacteroidales bacterium]